jgi:hypothetical protein
MTSRRIPRCSAMVCPSVSVVLATPSHTRRSGSLRMGELLVHRRPRAGMTVIDLKGVRPPWNVRIAAVREDALALAGRDTRPRGSRTDQARPRAREGGCACRSDRATGSVVRPSFSPPGLRALAPHASRHSGGVVEGYSAPWPITTNPSCTTKVQFPAGRRSPTLFSDVCRFRPNPGRCLSASRWGLGRLTMELRMNIRCLFGQHSYGLPRANGDGTVNHECMSCLRIDRAPLKLPCDEDATAALEIRRAQAIADLVSDHRWVGIPVKPPGNAIRNTESGEGKGIAGIRVSRPRAA